MLEKLEVKDIKGNKHLLGLFEKDAHYKEFITQGAKKYAYKVDDKIKITVAGVPKKGSKALKDLNYGNSFIKECTSMINNTYDKSNYTYDAKNKQWSGWSRIGDGITSTYYIDKTPNSGITYKYTVKACYGSYTSFYNTSGLDILSLETPELSSATSTKAGVKLEWDKITGASGYKVYRKTGNSGWGEAIATVKGNSTVTYLDKTAKKGVTYTYTVRAYNGNIKSGYIAEGKTVTDKY